jgi:hypothetical protein
MPHGHDHRASFPIFGAKDRSIVFGLVAEKFLCFVWPKYGIVTVSFCRELIAAINLCFQIGDGFSFVYDCRDASYSSVKDGRKIVDFDFDGGAQFASG